MVREDRRAALPGAWQAIAVITFGIALIGGILVRLTDPSRFHSIGAGMWWGMQTVTTVGYGDIVPQTPLGRLTGVLVMLVGISFITARRGDHQRVRRGRRAGAVSAHPAGPELAEIRGLREQVTALQNDLGQLRRVSACSGTG